MDSYYCEVRTDPEINTVELAQITSISGTHFPSKSDQDVNVFWTSLVTVKYFPRDLLKYFRNIQGIVIYFSKLEEIHQEDLKPFVNLISLRLHSNAIEIIEEGLFDYNPQLELVEFNEPKLAHIHVDVFDGLRHLRYFWFNQVHCIGKDISDSRGKVLEVITTIKENCISSEYSDLERKINNLKNELEFPNFEQFKPNLVNFEKIFKDSKFSKFRPLCESFKKLKFIDASNKFLSNSLQNITSKLDNIEFTQCLNNNSASVVNYIIDSVNDLKTSQKTIKESIADLSFELQEVGKKVTDSEVRTAEIVNGIQEHLMSKFEEILEEKLAKIINDKLNKVVNARIGSA